VIRRLGIVNRGEAAMRCIRTVKALRAREGSELQAVALYTEVERGAPFVRHADVAVPLRRAASEVAAYLDHDGVVEALRAGGADAVWPGWGFLAEDASFVERLDREGIAFLGPGAAAMRELGDKIAAKRLAEGAGVPVAAWSGGEVGNELQARAAAAAIGYPLVVKASAGGGGRGIRVVAEPPALADALRSARAEAESAFGDGRLFLERKIEGGRHIEVQIAADRHGGVIAFGCRDCSVQRRHQKVIEEAPPPGLEADLLAALEDAAVRLARAVGYVGVGTVEFLVAGQAYYFLEVNPRLQVEHGVSECLFGVDLVELQIRIARGESLPPRAPATGAPRHAIEARLCADDPDAGFLPSPGRIARFDAALGPGMRLDTGYTAGSVVPAAFDSLLAKVIATGATREEARARLYGALADFDLVVQGGATNKGYLLEILDDEEFRRGGTDTTWLDRFTARRAGAAAPYAVEGLIAAAILAYQRNRAQERLNFYADTTNLALSRVPASHGQQIVLTHEGETYRLEVYAVGAWRYRVHLDERAVAVALRDQDGHAARLEIGERVLRVLYDGGDAGLRLEIEGRPLRFGWDAAGHVRAGTPALVVAIDVAPGDRVEVGQPLGLLEAMKMEISFVAPIAGVVAEVRVRTGEQVKAGDVILVIETGENAAPSARRRARLHLPATADPLAALFTVADSGLAEVDLPALDAAPADARRRALAAVREEVRRVFLGYDASPERAELLASFLETPIPAELSPELRRDLAAIRAEFRVFADVEQLFVSAPRASIGGQGAPSNAARTRMFVRRLHAGGAGLAPEFLELVRAALAHYGVDSLAPGDALERAVLRLLATQRSPELRQRLLLALLRHVTALARGGLQLGQDATLAAALGRIAAMRGLVSHVVADAAAEAGYEVYERPAIEEQAERTTAEVELWLRAAEEAPAAPPESVLRVLAAAPRAVFERVGRWLAHGDPRRRAIALDAHLRRLYGPEAPRSHAAFAEAGVLGVRLVFGANDAGDLSRAPDLEVFACVCGAERVAAAVSWLRVAGEGPRRGASPALELFVPVADERQGAAVLAAARAALAASVPPGRFTLSLVQGGEIRHHTFVLDAAAPDHLAEDAALHGLHPETAARVNLARLSNFELERCEAPEGVYAFWARSRRERGDERVFVLAEVRSIALGREPGPHLAAFERTFGAATRALRGILAQRDSGRRLQWNRITILVAPEVEIDAGTVERVARRVAPATRNLGLEKVVVCLRRIDPASPERGAAEVEIVAADLTGANLEIQWRAPDRTPVQARTGYERKVVEARRRRLVYPYEIVRMLTGGSGAIAAGSFQEYDLDPDAAAPRAVPVSRDPGLNCSAVVFGLVSNPTRKIPEGMRRVLLLSDPTLGMGALAAPECDRVVAALDLAERLGVPVEWVPVSSGARIAMDSGTENLDATARVVRRIVEFTQNRGVIHVIVAGVNVGAQSYWNALSTMLMHTRGALIMTPGASMVLTGRAALEVSGGVAADDETGIGGFERIMGPNGEAQYQADDLADAFRLLHEHYAFTYVVPGEPGPRPFPTADEVARPLDGEVLGAAGEWSAVREIFDDRSNPGRKRAFPMRAVMAALVDRDGGHLERWRAWSGAETAIVWDAHLGGQPVCLIGIESQNLPREGYRPLDGPAAWTGGTLFPLSSKKVARALNAASGNRAAVVLANLSGFDGSPESMRKLQLEYGAEIARAVVNFEGPLLFLVVSRYHGGAYVVFSRALNPGLRAAALSGTYASVIGGGPAAAVVFAREVRVRAAADARVRALEEELRRDPGAEARERLERAREAATLEAQARIAAEFDAVHTVERALAVGSLEAIVEPADARAFLVGLLRAAAPPQRQSLP